MATSLEESEKSGPDQENSRKYLPFGEKIVKICPVDTELALLRVKKKKKKKFMQAKYIARLAGLPSGLNNKLRPQCCHHTDTRTGKSLLAYYLFLFFNVPAIMNINMT